MNPPRLARWPKAKIAGWLVALAGVVVAGTLGYRMVGHRARTASARVAPKALETWAMGQTRTYQVELISSVRMDAPVFAATVTGNWHLTRLADDAPGSGAPTPGTMRVAAVLEPARVELFTAPDSRAALSRALSEPALLVMGPNGTLESVRMPGASSDAAVDQLARGLLASLAATAQLTRGPTTAAAPWTAQERDLSGTYQAAYRTCGPSCLEKHKVRYLALNAPQQLKTKTLVDQSKTTYRFDGGLSLGALVSADGLEATHTESDGPFPKLASETTVRMRLVGVKAGAQASQPQWLADSAAWSDALRPEGKATAERGNSTTSGVRLEAMLDRIRELKRTQGATAQEARAYTELVRQLRGSDSDVDRALARILQGSDRGVLIDALGNAGSSRAQQALRTALEKANLSAQERYSVAMALSMVPKPERETVAVLTALTRDPDLKQQALYGLGASANSLRDVEPAAAEAIARDLDKRLDQTTSAGERITVIRAIGNSGSPVTLQRLAQLSRDPDPTMRAAAFDAMRFVPGPQADAHLAKGMTEDQDPAVRQACFGAAAYRDPSPSLVYALRKAMLDDPDPKSREQAVRTALRWTRQAAPLQAALAEVAQNDSSEAIRKIAGASTK